MATSDHEPGRVARDAAAGPRPDRNHDLLAPLLPAGEPAESLLRHTQFFVPGGTPSPDFREVHRPGGRGAEEFYRERWRHDKVVRSTHGVNCTGSCSWKVYVKDGIITWETQQTDYPSTGPDSPEYEPRGCPRGASFSWYTYSPSRVRYPYVRGELLGLWREALARLGDPVAAWAEITADPARAARYKQARGKGGFVRSTWPEVAELMAATLRERADGWVPDRFLTAADLGDDGEGGAHKTVLLDAPTGSPVVPNGSLGFRFTAAGKGRWNLDLGAADPVLTLHGRHDQAVPVDLPRFDTGPTEGGTTVRRGVPAIRIGGHLVTTVFDLLLAQYAVPRDGLPGQWPSGYDDAATPGTLVVIVTGIVPTLFVNLLGHGYDYRTTVAPWFRGLFSGSPDVTAIDSAPVVYQLHATAAWVIWMVWPFSRLVHAWSAPLWYVWRPYIVYRSRKSTPPAEPGTSGRRWRRISVRY